MGHRLSKIATRTGDQGITGLGDGSRVRKSSTRIQVMGEVDELNSWLGLLLAEDLPPQLRETLTNIQHSLFDLGAELCMPGTAKIGVDYVRSLEHTLGELNKALPPLKEFILPGGPPGAAVCHLARSVCRRAERSLVVLAEAETVNPPALAYLNRLSDLLFVIARTLVIQTDQSEPQWDPHRLAPTEK
ncbi:MAG: cob(I)yrinic acid a,c-diamide adenosyltransferase [Gammaproteobacteria bacterium]